MAERRPPRPGGGSRPRPGGGAGKGPGGGGGGYSRGPGGGAGGGGGGQARRPSAGGGPPRRPSGPGGPRPTGGPKAGPRPRVPAKPREATVPGEERLNKLLAHAGLGSRRACEELILQGRVTVDGKVVRELATKINPGKSSVAVDGQRIHEERHVYIAVYKPKGYVSTNNDPSGRPRVLDLLPEIPQRVYTIGRLDEASTGLMLLTNDGDLANKLAHPKFGVEKIYRVVVAGTPTQEVLDQLTEGIWLAEGKVRAKRVRIVGKRGESTILEMVLAEGKNREVRRMLAKLGNKVMNLTRVAVGPISIKGLKIGESRPLTGREIDMLRRAAAGEFIPFSARKPARSEDRPRPEGQERPARPPQGYGQGPPPRGRMSEAQEGPRPARRPDQGPRPQGPVGRGRPPMQQDGPRPPRGDRPPMGAGRPPMRQDGPRPGPRPRPQGEDAPRGPRRPENSGPPPRRPSGPPPRPVVSGPEPDIEISPIDDSNASDRRPRRILGLNMPKPATARPGIGRSAKPKPPRRNLSAPKGMRLKRKPPAPDGE